MLGSIFGGGGNNNSSAHIDDEVTIEEDGVKETITVSMDLEGPAEEVAQQAANYKNNGGAQQVAGPQCADCDQPNQTPSP